MLDELFSCLTAWLAPVLCFTAEEAWLERNPGPDESVHLRLFPDVPDSWRNDALADTWARVREVRRVVTGALELERAAKRLGSSLQAAPLVHVARPELRDALDEVDLAEVAITSAITVTDGPAPDGAFLLDEVPGVAVQVRPAEGDKCQRCWRILPEVGSFPHAPGVCGRCADAVEYLGAAAQ